MDPIRKTATCNTPDRKTSGRKTPGRRARRRALVVGALALLLLPAVPVVRAEDEAPPAPAPRDPFTPDPRMLDETEETAPGALPRTAPVLGVGVLGLRGYVEDHDGRVLALLEVEGRGVHLVRVGDAIAVPSVGGTGGDVLVRVKAIGPLDLRAEVGESRREVVVR